jgi:hypothetical protein
MRHVTNAEMTLQDLFAGVLHFAAQHPKVMLVVLAFCFYKFVRAVHRRQLRRRRRSDGYGLPPSYRVPPSLPAPPPPIVRPVAPPRPQRVPGHPDYCPCRGCRAAAVAETAAAMPPPSDEIAPVLFEAPCDHRLGVEAVYVGGELMRYTCRDGRCYATWPPGTPFPPGTAIHDPEA